MKEDKGKKIPAGGCCLREAQTMNATASSAEGRSYRTLSQSELKHVTCASKAAH